MLRVLYLILCATVSGAFLNGYRWTSYKDSLRTVSTKTCDLWDVRIERCIRCKCIVHHWMCMGRWCPELHDPKKAKGAYHVTEEELLYLQECKEGDKHQLDACTQCFCYGHTQWACIRFCEIRKPELPTAILSSPCMTSSTYPCATSSTIQSTTSTTERETELPSAITSSPYITSSTDESMTSSTDESMTSSTDSDPDTDLRKPPTHPNSSYRRRRNVVLVVTGARRKKKHVFIDNFII